MKLPIILASALLIFTTTGCGAAPGTSQPSDSAKSRSTAGKPGADADVVLISGGSGVNGATLPLQLQFRTGHPNTAVSVEYRVEGALVLQSASQAQLRTGLDGNVIDTPTVRALANGVHFLNVFVTVGKRGRAISIPVTIGTALPKAKASGKTITTPQGDSVIVLPAQETVH